MTTAQDQQSRAEFEIFWRKEMNVEAMDLARTNYPMTLPEKQQYLCHETNRAWITWQAARALPDGVVPVAEVLSSRPGNDTSTIDKAFAAGTKLFTAAQVLAMGRVPMDAEATWDAFAEAVRVKVGVKELVNIMGSVDSLRETFLKAAHGITHPTGD